MGTIRRPLTPSEQPCESNKDRRISVIVIMANHTEMGPCGAIREEFGCRCITI